MATHRGIMSTISRQLQLETNFNIVKEKIDHCAWEHKVPKPPRLVAVSKYKSSDDIKALYDLGQRHFGENYVQELTEKAKKLPDDIQWHFIGALQTNKCRLLAGIPNLYALETLDSINKADKLNRLRVNLPKLHIFIQINTSGEAQKNGISYKDPDAIVQLAKYIDASCPNLQLDGFMTIGSHANSVEQKELNEDFTRLVTLNHELSRILGRNFELSMGMSNDYLEAIKQGSTSVRVGSAIFGIRLSKLERKPTIG